MAFLDDHYLLSSDLAFELWLRVKDLPIIDAHNHADVKEICENLTYTDIWHAEAATDHYVWEMMRKRGVSEPYITGNHSNEEKWLALADVFDELAGSPTFEWIHLDLKRQLGIEDMICGANGKKIWDDAKRRLKQDDMRPQALLKRTKVEVMCSTDDPIDSLEYHRKLQQTLMVNVVRPTFRPDKAMNIFKPEWPEYLKKMEDRVGEKFKCVADLVKALRSLHDYFADHGCMASDHGMEVPYGFNVSEAEADAIFKRARDGGETNTQDMVGYMSYILHQVAEMDAAKGWVFQLHIGAVRDVRTSLLDTIGPDSGGDVSSHFLDLLTPLVPFLNRFDDRLKVVLYCLEPHHQATLTTVARAFGSKVNLGSAWWLNDSPVGMRRQLEYIGSVDLLMNFAGMVSDSRKLMSYGSRHEMFRRVLCDVVGEMVLRGQMPRQLGEKMVEYLAYKRPKELFGF